VKLFENLVAHLFYDSGPGVKGLVHPVTETHQTKGIVSILGPGDKWGRITAIIVYLLKHFNDRLIGSSVKGAPEGRYSGQMAA